MSLSDAALVLVMALVMAACGGGEPDPVVLLGGDVHGEPPVAEALAEGVDVLAGVRDELATADVVVVNLETPVGPGGTPARKAITFRADPVLLEQLADGGVDVVNLANNHAFDHGPEVLAQTVERARAAGLAVVGAGADAEAAWAPVTLDVAGRRVAVLGMSDVVPAPEWVAEDSWGIASALDHDRAARAVEAAAARADHVVVTVHWGDEFRACPSVVQTELGRRLVEAGADVVAGHHPHVVQGVERRGDAVVAYSLGNLVFYAATAETRDAALLRVTLSDADAPVEELLPVVLDAGGLPQPADARSAERIAERIRVRSPGGGTCPAPVWDGLPGRRAEDQPD